MAVGSITAGNEEGVRGQTAAPSSKQFGGKGLQVKTDTRLFVRKNPGSPGKLGKASGLSESLSKLRGKGALA